MNDQKKPSALSGMKATMKKAQKGYSNPAFAMLGIRRIKLPSRNWSIFICVVSALVGGAAYDKYQQKIQRRQYMTFVKPLGQEPYDAGRLPRKIRIYAAPPPNDYLNETLKYFRRFVKPMLNSAGIDFELITEDRQGKIRNSVAKEIRKIRKDKLGLPELTAEQEQEKKQKEEAEKAKEGAQNRPKNMMNINPAFSMAMKDKKEKPDYIEDEDPKDGTKAVKDLYNPSDVLGLTKYLKDSPKIHVKSDDAEVANSQDAGGIICLGRGAYKEYITGVHEGLLGPLYEPERLRKIRHAREKKREEEIKEESKLPEKKRRRKELEREEREKDDADKPELPYILPKEYPDYEIANELELGSPNATDDKGIPYFFTQPVLVLRIYAIAGITKLFERMRRFYTKRTQQIDYNESVYGLIKKKCRPMTVEDKNLMREEEDDWPAPWVKRGKEKHSEWCQDLEVDPKVTDILSVYERVPIDLSNVVPEKTKKEKKERKPWV